MYRPGIDLIEFHPLSKIEELDQVVEFQRTVWAYEDLDIESRAILTVGSRFSGQLIGAFCNQVLIGFSFALAMMEPGRLHSHRVGVLPAYQNAGIGKRLKLAQRDDALSRGFHVIQWTFDPLLSRNAYFNLRKLGGLGTSYLPNLYGLTSSPLHGGLPTDRLLIEWNLESPRVCKTLAGEFPAAIGPTVHIRLPTQAELRDPSQQERLRCAFQTAFQEGHVLVDMERLGDEQNYILEKI